MTLSDKVQNLISKLPPELQPYAPHYIDLLQRFTYEEIQGIVNQAIGGDSLAAYQAVVAKMTNDEVIAELERLNKVMDGLIDEARVETETLRNFVNTAIAVGLSAS